MYVVVNIGCIECGVTSKIVGMFSDKIKADSVADQCDERHDWREGGQNHYQVFELPPEGVIDPEYEGVAINPQ